MIFAQRDRLKAETSKLHMGLHDLDVFRDLMARKLTIERYRTLVASYFGYYQPFESALSKKIAADCNAEILNGYVQRTPLFSLDLLDLGVDGKAQDGLPRCQRLPIVETEAALLGTLYVIEGSTLGGRLLYRQLDAIFGPRDVRGRRYFRWCADQGNIRWSRLCAAIETYGFRSADGDAMSAAAQETFSTLLLWLSGLNSPLQLKTLEYAKGDRDA